eukprot:GFUD01108148.1.p1 GENE.GFUD01108148.1~~GFUD01108148.1.p1  ORF type:complete len:262 (+),score=107.40 GFUD01108148.1:55-840(+)
MENLVAAKDMDSMVVSLGVVVTTLASVTLATAAFVWTRRGRSRNEINEVEIKSNDDDFEEINASLQNVLKNHILEKTNDVKGDINVKKMQMNKRIEALLKEKEEEINVKKTEYINETEAIEKKYKNEIEIMSAELETEIIDMKKAIGNLRIILASSTEDAERVETTKSELECPVCMEEMKPPRRIWQCSDGHAVCEHCRKKPAVTCCPTCRKYIVGRSTIAEKMARSLFGQEQAGGDCAQREEQKLTLTGYREVKIEREVA